MLRNKFIKIAGKYFPVIGHLNLFQVKDIPIIDIPQREDKEKQDSKNERNNHVRP